MSRTPTASVAALLAAVLLPLTACSSDQEQYCDAVEEHQAELSDIAAQGGPGALLEALPVYRDLRDRAPADIRDEWDQVISSLEGLQQALDDAGVQPEDYDPKDTSVPRDDRDAIAAAADEVGSAETARALAGVEQQARDVCHTPLVL